MYAVYMIEREMVAGVVIRDPDYPLGTYVMNQVHYYPHKLDDGPTTLPDHKGTTLFTVNERDIAEYFTKYLARQYPNYEVYMTEIKSVASAVVSDVVLKSVSDRGILPQ